jgi:hypothetical protein
MRGDPAERGEPVEPAGQAIGSASARRRWHPLVVAGVLAACAGCAALIDLTGRAPRTPATAALWMSIGALAGFATSGST